MKRNMQSSDFTSALNSKKKSETDGGKTKINRKDRDRVHIVCEEIEGLTDYKPIRPTEVRGVVVLQENLDNLDYV